MVDIMFGMLMGAILCKLCDYMYRTHKEMRSIQRELNKVERRVRLDLQKIEE